MNDTGVSAASIVPARSSGAAPICPDAFIASMRGELEKVMREVAQAVNAAPDGQWIEGGECQVREAMGRLRERVFQEALQMRLNAAEAAFSPSAQRGDGQASGGQGPV